MCLFLGQRSGGSSGRFRHFLVSLRIEVMAFFSVMFYHTAFEAMMEANGMFLIFIQVYLDN